MRTLSDRFWDKVTDRPDTNGCLLWTASTTFDGYGHMRARGTVTGAHRVSWEIHNGPVPQGQCVLHKCDVRRCVNPAHLFLGTRQDNNEDMKQKGRARSPQGEAHGGTHLTNAAARWIRANPLRLSQRKLGKLFGVGKSTIGRIQRGENWRTV